MMLARLEGECVPSARARKMAAIEIADPRFPLDLVERKLAFIVRVARDVWGEA